MSLYRHHKIFLVFITAIASITGLLIGLDTGIIGGSQYFIYRDFQVSSTLLEALTVAAVPIGALLGAILSAKMAVYYGRKKSLLLTGLLFFLGGSSITCAVNMDMLIIGRLLMGISVGLSSMIAPMYLSELAPNKLRGTLVFMFQLAVTLGILLAYGINDLFAYSGNWRVMFALCLIPSLILFIGTFFLPHSPRWLMQRGHEKQAKAIIKKLGHQEVENELSEIKISIQHQKASFRIIFQKRYFPLVLLVVGLFFFQQLSGINTIFYYVNTAFTKAYPHNIQGEIIASLIAGGVNVIATILAAWIIDLVGRRCLLLFGMGGIVFCLVLLSLSFHDAFAAESGLISLIAMLVFILFFAISLGGIPYLIMAEIFPINVKHIGMAIASFSNWSLNAVVAFSYLYLVHGIGLSKTYLLYAVVTGIGFFFMWKYLPETKNISLEEIEAHLIAGKPLRKIGQ